MGDGFNRPDPDPEPDPKDQPDPEDEPDPFHYINPVPNSLTLTAAAAQAIRSEIRRAKANEVCFIGSVDEDGSIVAARAVARGTTLVIPYFRSSNRSLSKGENSRGVKPPP